MDAKRVFVSGVVQGVGFRPFVYGLAARHSLRGWVRNTSAGVDIEIEGDPRHIDLFLDSLRFHAPPLARVEAVTVKETPANGHTAFVICDSVPQPGAFQPIPPDVALCLDCERELFDPNDRRYLYPFINCTHCGPRFTLIRDLPYDRPLTTMSAFGMCPECEREYTDPLNRRFHAQPIACPRCGPSLEIRDWRLQTQSPISNRQSLLVARRLLREGNILAVKGLGGFHLACDATNPDSVAELRRRKGRIDKPFAIMADSLATGAELCQLNNAERELLIGREKPIVLLKARSDSTALRACEDIAPNLDTLGVMLPYTPLHHLLLNQTDPALAAEPTPRILVMTSGNLSEEPICADNAEALTRLAPLADAFLLHNRDIHQRCDDSIMKVIHHQSTACGSLTTDYLSLSMRRSRGYAPSPIHLPHNSPPLLAVGGELKNAVCLARDRYAFLSQHIGDLENVETLAAFEQSIEHLSRLFRIQPQVVAYDLHPDYLSTQYALRNPHASRALRIPVQHHHAHIAACMADNGLGDQPLIGLAFDGTGYGTDGAIWGGEFLIADYRSFIRVAHLEYLPLPGGDAAIRDTWRIGLGYAAALDLDVGDLPFLRPLDPRAVEIVRKQVAKKLNAPLTSSLGRLFDAVAALAGGRTLATYEAQAAIEMEAAAQNVGGDLEPYPFSWDWVGEARVIRLRELLQGVIDDARRDETFAVIGRRLHYTLASLVTALCRDIRLETGLDRVALSGGVWQNALLLELTIGPLQKEGFTVYTHRQIPANDGGLSLGQAAIAARQVSR